MEHAKKKRKKTRTNKTYNGPLLKKRETFPCQVVS